MKRVTVAEINMRLRKCGLKVMSHGSDNICIGFGGVNSGVLIEYPKYGGEWFMVVLDNEWCCNYAQLKHLPGILLSLNTREFNANSKAVK